MPIRISTLFLKNPLFLYGQNFLLNSSNSLFSNLSNNNLNKIASAFNIDIYELIDSDNNILGTSESGLYTKERLKLTSENVFRLIEDIGISENIDYSLMDDDLDYITSSLKNHLMNLVEFATHKNNNFLYNQTSILNDLNKDNNK